MAMKLFFVNPRYNVKRWDGARVHITQVARYLQELGHELYITGLYHIDGAKVLPAAHLERLRTVSKLDVAYFRIEGRAPDMPLYLKRPFRWIVGRLPIVWELNSTPELGFGGQADINTNFILDKMRVEARYVDLAVCNTDGLRKFAGDLGIKNAITIPLASDPDLFRPDALPNHSISRDCEIINVVWCGNSRIAWHDFYTIMESAYRLEKNKNFRFYLIADQFPENFVVPRNMTHIRELPYSEMPGFLAAMDIGLAIYRSEEWSRYGTFSSPLKVFDYLSSGLVVVGSPIEQLLKLHESAPNSVQIVPFESPQGLVDKLISLEKKIKLNGISYGNDGRYLVANYYNWRRVAIETELAIKKII